MSKGDKMKKVKLIQHYAYLIKINKLLKMITQKADHSAIQRFVKREKIKVNSKYQYQRDININAPYETLLHYVIFKYIAYKEQSVSQYIRREYPNSNITTLSSLLMNSIYHRRNSFLKEQKIRKTFRILGYLIKGLNANSDATNSYRQTPIQYALDNGAPELGWWLDKKLYSSEIEYPKRILKDDEALSVAYYNDLNNFIDYSLPKINPNGLYNNKISIVNFGFYGYQVFGGQVPLLFLTNGKKSILEKILKRGADPNYRIKDFRDKSFLHIYLSFTKNWTNAIELLALFKYYEYDFDLMDGNKDKLLNIILYKYRSSSFQQVIKEKKQNIINKYFQIVTFLLMNTQNPNAIDGDGWTLFLLMVDFGLWDQFKELILSSQYDPFIDLCVIYSHKDELIFNVLYEPLNQKEKKEKIDIIYQLSKKYLMMYYLKYIETKKFLQKGGGDNMIIPAIDYVQRYSQNNKLEGGKSNNEFNICSSIEEYLFNKKFKSITDILYNIIDKDDLNDTLESNISNISKNNLNNKLTENLNSIDNFFKNLDPKIYGWCQFKLHTFVENNSTKQKLIKLCEMIYHLLHIYIKKPIDPNIDIIIDKYGDYVRKYVFTTGDIFDDLYFYGHIYKKHKNKISGTLLKEMVKYKELLPTKRHKFKDLFLVYLFSENTKKGKLSYSRKSLKLMIQGAKKTKRFVISSLWLESDGGGGHANAIIYDKKHQTLERFEPHGTITDFYDLNDCDDEMMKFVKVLSKKFGKKIKYIGPRELETEFGPQASEEFQNKVGDPGGYCVTWSWAYVDLRLSNPNLSPQKLFDKIMDELRKRGMRIKDYARNYVKYALNYREKILDEIGITYDDLISNNYNEEQLKKMIQLFKQYVDL